MKVKELNEYLFDTHPVWKWDDGHDYYVPVKKYNPLPEHEITLFIKSFFEAPDGRNFKGYLVGTDTFYAFGLFVNSKEYVLNFNLRDMIWKDVLSIKKDLNDDDFILFPLKYKTDFDFKGEPKLSGTLSIKE